MKYLKVFTDFVYSLELLGEAERGRLFTAMLKYAESGAEPELKGNEKFLWLVARSEIDRQRESYDKRCKINKDIATNRHQNAPKNTNRNETCQDKDKDKDKDNNPPISPLTGGKREKAKLFTPPLLDDVRDYCKSRGNGIDPDEWYDFYASKGWMIGRNKMVDWKAAVRTWEIKRKASGAKQDTGNSQGNSQEPGDFAERMRAQVENARREQQRWKDQEVKRREIIEDYLNRNREGPAGVDADKPRSV